MASDLKKKSVSGMLWTTIERFTTQGIQFVIGIFIARILMPGDYGIIGMLAIFMAIAQSFLDSGFASALIQKKDRTENDYSTVFYFNLVVAVLLYALFYVSAPWIAGFYKIPILSDVARVTSLSLILNGLTIVQTAKLTIDLNFKFQAITSIVSVVLSGMVGILMAYNGYGVWALVWQGIMAALVRLVVLWLASSWRPKLIFSMDSFRILFSFGSKLLCSGMINTIYQNIYTIVIGKAFGASDVGYYNRGNQFASIPTDTTTAIVTKVNFPILSSLQDDNEKLLQAYRKMLRVPLFALFPLLTGLIALAHPLVEFVLGEKWLPCVPILQILCLGCMWSPMTHINLNLLYVKGRSDLVLKLELVKKPIAFLLLFALLPFGILWMCVGRALYFFIAFSMNCYYTHKILGYGFSKQIREISFILLNCAVMWGVVTLCISFATSLVIKLAIGLLTGALSYTLIAYFANDSSLQDIRQIIEDKIQVRKRLHQQ